MIENKNKIEELKLEKARLESAIWVKLELLDSVKYKLMMLRRSK